MHSATPPSRAWAEQNMFWEHKGKGKRKKIIPQAFYQASAFMAKSKGHVSLPGSERGNYPFPVRGQQIIANYWGTFAGAEICQ